MRGLYGTLRLGRPRFYRCSCQGSTALKACKSFGPLAEALPERTLPERLYLESKWASLVSYGVTARLLEDVLPLDGEVNPNGIRRHTHRVGQRCEPDLLAELDTEPGAEEWPVQQYSATETRDHRGTRRRLHSLPRRTESARGLVRGDRWQVYGTRGPGHAALRSYTALTVMRGRVGAVLKSQGIVYHQPVTFVSDGGDAVRSWPSRLHPRAEHVIDWFHIAIRFTVLKQMVIDLHILDANPDDPADHPGRLLDGAKWLLWDGNVHHALQPIDTLIELIEHDERVPESPERRKLARTLRELYDYVDTNCDLIPDYGDRRRHGEVISSSIAESTINQVVSPRFVKKQQVRWEPQTAHLLPQVRTRTLNGTLRETFQRWWPAMAPDAAPGLS